MPIDPIDEPLVEVTDIGDRVRAEPRYHQMGLPGAHERCVVREGVAQALARVARRLPAGLTLLVWDGWRAFETQQALYDTWVDELVGAHPDWSSDRIAVEAARYVTPPSADPTCPAPHLTGGAVDLTLADTAGRPLDLGTDFDAFEPAAGALAFEKVPGTARDLRRALFWAMAGEGFTAYVEEWWHYDLGDQFWGAIRGTPARYGPARYA